MMELCKYLLAQHVRRGDRLWSLRMLEVNPMNISHSLSQTPFALVFVRRFDNYLNHQPCSLYTELSNQNMTDSR
jgi:hypothetical protein